MSLGDGGTVVLHLGLGKTGSSALQVGLVRNRDALARAGVFYPPHESDALAARGDVTSGNGMLLARFLVPWLHSPEEATQAHLESILETVAARSPSCRSVLYSSEFLYHFGETQLRMLDHRIRELGMSLRFVVYVRDVAGHALSEYRQKVRRAGLTVSFSDFLRADDEGYHPSLRDRCEILRAVGGNDSLTMVHYDSVRARLVPHFFEEVLGLTVAFADVDPIPEQVNRSLTDWECLLMRRVNELVADERLVRRAGDALASVPPCGPDCRTILSQDAEHLAARFSQTVKWVNRLEPLGGDLALLGDVPVVKGHSRETLPAREDRVLVWMAELLSSGSRS